MRVVFCRTIFLAFPTCAHYNKNTLIPFLRSMCSRKEKRHTYTVCLFSALRPSAIFVCGTAAALYAVNRYVHTERLLHAASSPHVAFRDTLCLLLRQVKRLDPRDSSLGCHAMQHSPYFTVLLVHPALRRLADRLAAGWCHRMVALSPVAPFLDLRCSPPVFQFLHGLDALLIFMMASTPCRTSDSSYPCSSISL